MSTGPAAPQSKIFATPSRNPQRCRLAASCGFATFMLFQGVDAKMNTTKLFAGLGAMALSVLAGAAQAADTNLDRAGLLKLADTYLGSLVAHDPKKVPFASDVKVVENVTRIKAGE